MVHCLDQKWSLLVENGMYQWLELIFTLSIQTVLDSHVSCHFNCTLRSYLCKIILKERCLFFLQVWTLHWRSMYWIKSLWAWSYPDHWLPGNPASQKAIPQAFVQTHMGGARLREAERHVHLHPKWLWIMSGSEMLHLLLTLLSTIKQRLFIFHIVLCEWRISI